MSATTDPHGGDGNLIDRWIALPSLPADGLWSWLGLTREQFFGILAAACVAFAVLGGPFWTDLQGAHFARIFWSYLLIPAMVYHFQWRNQSGSFRRWLEASLTIAAAKLLITATLFIAVAFMR